MAAPRKLLCSFVGVALAFAVAAAGCDKMRSNGAGSGGGASGSTTGPILVGEYGSLTGSEATFGQSTHNGIMLAVDEQNAAGGVKGRQIAIQKYDDQGKQQEAVTAVTRLITNDHVVAIIGEVASSLSLAAAPKAQAAGIPMISPSSTNAQVTEKGDMIFRVCFIDDFQGFVGAKFARENLKLSKAAILYDQSQAYSKGLSEDFKKAFLAQGGTITTEQAYNKGDTDFSAQLGTIKDSGAEIIYVPGYYTEVANIAIQARKIGLTMPLLGGDGWDSPQLAQIGGAAIEGSYYSNHYAADNASPEVADFVKKYKAKYGVVPDGLAALGYDAAKVLFAAMDRAPSLGGKDLAAAIGATKDFHGVTGRITIDEKRNASKPAVIVQMKNGAPSFVATVNPS